MMPLDLKLRRLSYLLSLAILLSGCTSLFDDVSEQRDADNYIASASAFFENEVANGNAFGDKEDVFYFGDIAPDWSSAVVRTDYLSGLRFITTGVTTRLHQV